MTRSLATAVAVLGLMAAACAMVEKARKPAQAEQVPPPPTTKTPQTTSSGSK